MIYRINNCPTSIACNKRGSHLYTGTNLITGEDIELSSHEEFVSLVTNEMVLHTNCSKNMIYYVTTSYLDDFIEEVLVTKSYVVLGTEINSHLFALLSPDVQGCSPVYISDEVVFRLKSNGLKVLQPDAKAAKFSMMYGVNAITVNDMLMSFRVPKDSESIIPMHQLFNSISPYCEWSAPQSGRTTLEFTREGILSLIDSKSFSNLAQISGLRYKVVDCTDADIARLIVKLVKTLTKSWRDMLWKFKDVTSEYIELTSFCMLETYLEIDLFLGDAFQPEDINGLTLYTTLSPEARLCFAEIVDMHMKEYAVTYRNVYVTKFSSDFVTRFNNNADGFYKEYEGVLLADFSLESLLQGGWYSDKLSEMLLRLYNLFDNMLYIWQLYVLVALAKLEYFTSGNMQSSYGDYLNFHMSLLFEVLNSWRPVSNIIRNPVS